MNKKVRTFIFFYNITYILLYYNNFFINNFLKQKIPIEITFQGLQVSLRLTYLKPLLTLLRVSFALALKLKTRKNQIISLLPIDVATPSINNITTYL